MTLFSVSFALANHGDHPDPEGDLRARRDLASHAAFSLGQAWHADWNSIFIRTDMSIDEVVSRLAVVILDSDLLLVTELSEAAQTRVAGLICDCDGFDAIFPKAIVAVPTGMSFAPPPAGLEPSYEIRSTRFETHIK